MDSPSYGVSYYCIKFNEKYKLSHVDLLGTSQRTGKYDQSQPLVPGVVAIFCLFLSFNHVLPGQFNLPFKYYKKSTVRRTIQKEIT